jgi:small-conductance mechanosensitive channel
MEPLSWAQIWNIFLVYIGRPSVQLQLFTISIVVLASKIVGKRWQAWLQTRVRDLEETSFAHKGVYYALHYLFPGIFLLAAIWGLHVVFSWTNLRTGLLVAFANIAWLYLGMTAIVALLHVAGSNAGIQKYRHTLILPLFGIVLGRQFLQIFFHSEQLTNLTVFTMFDRTITLSALLLTTIGFYLWLVGIRAIGEGAQYLITRYSNVDEGSTQATLTLIRYLLVVAGLGYILYRLNFDPTTVAAISGGLSVGAGFALSTILSNFLSGILLLFEHTLRPGDVIEVNGEISIVDVITIRSIRVHTLDNVEKIIPNSEFITSSFTTYTGKTTQVRLRIPIGASYDDNYRDVIHTLLQVAAESPYVLKKPAPDVRIEEFGDSSINYIIYAWIANPVLASMVKDNLHRAILDAFEHKGITIPFPIIHLIQSKER